jgi:ABC-type bacteriocin/lantibiotic exporter with double-glycine peptidase domain
MFIIPSLVGQALQNLQMRYSDQLSVFTGKAKDILSGYEVIRSFQIGNFVKKKYDKENENLNNTKLAAEKLNSLNESLSMVLAAMTQLVVIFIASWYVMQGKFSVGVLLALIQLSSSFVSPIITVMQSLSQIKGSNVIKEKFESIIQYKEEDYHGEVMPIFNSCLEVVNVEFSYKQDEKILENLNVYIKKGNKYAIVGESGCGKTTFIRLLTAAYTGYFGNILLDGVDISKLNNREYIKLFSVIHQQVYLFDDDIGMNIGLYGNFSKDEWEYALDVSGVSKFLNKFPNGLDTRVGENGCNLSGGQRQRIAVARAILHKAPILILDEGTSAIDMQTAYDIEKRLIEIPNLTLLTITHNMSEELLSQYDEILFMRNGTLSQSGNLAKLLENNCSFRDFYKLHI